MTVHPQCAVRFQCRGGRAYLSIGRAIFWATTSSLDKRQLYIARAAGRMSTGDSLRSHVQGSLGCHISPLLYR